MLEFIAEQTSDVFLRVDQTGVITYVSPSIRLFGHEPEVLMGTRGLELLHPDDRPRMEANTAALLRGEIEVGADRQYRLRKPDGSWRWIEGSPRVVRNEAEVPVELVTVFRDVTERRAVEAAVRDGEARYRAIVEQMNDLVIQLNFEAVLTHVSPSSRSLGYEPEQLIGRKIDDFMHPDDAAQAAVNRAALQSGQLNAPLQSRVRRVRKANGEWAWLEGESQVMKDASGKPVAVLLVLRDVTDRQNQQELFEATFNHAPVAMTLTGLDGKFLRANPAFYRMLGMGDAAPQGFGALDITHPDGSGVNVEALKNLLSGEIDSYVAERRFRRVDGSYVWAQVAMALVRNADGSPKHFISHALDLTARREAEAALRDSEVRYRVIAEQTLDIIAMSDRKSTITYLSPSVRQLGFQPEDLVGRPFAPHIHPDDASAMWRLLKGQKPGAPAQRIRWRARHHLTGEWVWLESMPTRLWDPETGEPTGFLDVIRDVSLQVEQEEALAQARADAEAAAAVKSQFLANMSHEIRTPLTAVLGYSEILVSAPGLDEETQSYARRIAGAGSALLAVVNDILDFSKLEAGMVEVRLRPTEISPMVDDTLALFEGRAGEKGLNLRSTVAADLPAAVMMDSDRLRQILVNLVGNAVKFTDTGSVTLRVTADAGGETLRFEVEDTGPGLDPVQSAGLFQRFNQIDGTLSRRHGGTGLGLAICKGLAEAMGGEVGVNSRPGQGSVFYLTLPLHAAETGTEPDVAEEVASVAGLRVLVVDDNAVNRELARRILEAFGAEVSDAGSGDEALRRLAVTPVDVVLMDLRMPDLDGREVLARMRVNPGPNRLTPVLAFTADAEVGDGAGLGAFDGVVRKPIDTMALAETVVRAASEAAGTRSPTKATLA